MEKKISYSQFQSVKSVAKAIDPIMRKLKPIEAKIKALAEEYKGYQAQIDALEQGIVQIVGFHVSDLVKKVIEPGVDSKGNPIKTTKYLPTDIVSYDEQHKQYVITTPSAEELSAQVDAVKGQDNTELPTTADGFGSDFDLDKERIEQATIEPVESEVF